MDDKRVKIKLMHAEDKRYVFVRVMSIYWVRVNKCVAIVECPICKAEIGECCISNKVYVTYTHYQRRNLATKKVRNIV